MKKILSLFAAVLFASSMMAAVTLDYSTKGYSNNTDLDGVAVEEGGVTFTLAKGTGTSKPAYYDAGTGGRTYGGNLLTIDAGEKTMTSIVFTFTQNNKNYTVDSGTYSKDDKKWTGSAKKVVFTTESGSGHNRIKAITVYLDGEGPAPVVYDTLTVAQAIAATQALDSMKTSEKEVFVKGYVVYADPYSPSYNNQTFFLSDDPAVKDSTFEAYGALPKIGKDTIPVVDGDKVLAFGFLKKYYDTKKKVYQLEMGNPAVEILDTVPGQDRSLPDIPTISVDSALKIGNALADKAVTSESYIIEGYVSYVYSFYNEDYGSESLLISDDKDSRSADMSKVFEIYNGKPNTKKQTGLGAKVRVKCKIKKYGTTIENDGSNIAVEVLEPSTIPADTITVEQAVEIATPLAADAKTEVFYVVKGFVNQVTTGYATKNKNATFTMAQFPNEAEGALTAYRANILKADSNKVHDVGTASSDLYVLVTGYLTKHNSAAQIAQGAAVAFVEAPVMDTIHVTAAEAVAAGLLLPVEGKSDYIYAVTGIALDADPDSWADGVQAESVSISDDAEATVSAFTALNAKIAEAIKAGDKVEVVGRLVNIDGENIMIEGGKARIIYPEGIENIELTEKAQKVVVDGAVYIIRDNKMFNIHGAQVR